VILPAGHFVIAVMEQRGGNRAMLPAIRRTSSAV
jgi:hypothetical protein